MSSITRYAINVPLKNKKIVDLKTASYKTRTFISQLWDIFVQDLELPNETKKSQLVFYTGDNISKFEDIFFCIVLHACTADQAIAKSIFYHFDHSAISFSTDVTLPAPLTVSPTVSPIES